MFVVSGYEVGEWSLVVYDRWGKEVYQTSRYLNDWGRGVTAGTYFYLLRRAPTSRSTTSTVKGWLQVMR